MSGVEPLAVHSSAPWVAGKQTETILHFVQGAKASKHIQLCKFTNIKSVKPVTYLVDWLKTQSHLIVPMMSIVLAR